MKIFDFYTLFVLSGLVISTNHAEASGPDLSDLLRLAMENNPGIQAEKYRRDAEDSRITSSATLDDPMIGLSTLNRGNETRYAVISQKVRFPVKYFLQADIQFHQAEAQAQVLREEELKLRGRVIELYYAIYSTQKTIELTKANIDAVREFARVAERKYAAGKATQSDSMKAHFEITQLELEKIRLEQKENSLQVFLRESINDEEYQRIEFFKQTLTAPVLNDRVATENKIDIGSSPLLARADANYEKMESGSALASWEFAPDLQFQYQQRISGNPVDSKIYSINISFPLWFWRKSAESSAAAAGALEAEMRKLQTLRKVHAKAFDLKTSVISDAKAIKIYETSLIPQAVGAYNASQSAYRANKTSFLNLLDSERSLFRVRQSYYQVLEGFVKKLTDLEVMLGSSVSTLPKYTETKE